MSKESLNEKHLDYLFQKPAFVNALKNLVRKISSKIKNEDVEQLVNDVYVKVKSRIYSKGGLSLEEDTVEKMAAYCKKTVERLAIDLVTSSRYSREVFTTDTGWEGGHVTGDEVSTEDVAARGWGSRPSSLDDRVLLSETERMFDSPEKELGNRKDKGELRRLLDQYGGMNEVNPTSPDSATFIDVAKERIKEESGLDWDLEIMKAKEDPNPMSRKHRIDALEDMLATKTNTLGRKTMRGWDSLNEWADKTNFSKNSGVNMMRELVKVATRLDALGLTAEADVVDRLIRKIATDGAKTIEDSYSHSHSEPVSLKSHDREDFNRRNDAFYEKMRSSGTPMSPMGEHRPYMHELYPSSYKPRKPTTQAEFDAILGPESQYAPFDLLNQRGVEPEQFSERLHGDSYEMDEDEILSGIDEERELESMFPAEHSFRRSSSTRRGMRKSS